MNTSFEEQLKNSGKLIYTNVGGSMLPLLREGKDIMVIEPAETYKRLDAVLFRRPGITGRGAYILHRILQISPDGQKYWIVGDNCLSGETVEKTDILGVLTSIHRNGKTVKITDFRYRMYVRIWCAPYHLRFFILKVLRLPVHIKEWMKRNVF